jgi:hypothetical protein
MKIKILALTFSMMFFGSITATSYAQIVKTGNSITVVDNGDGKDKKKKKTKSSKETMGKKSCDDVKKSCCGSVQLKDDGCKDKKSNIEKSDKDKK